MQTQSMRNFYDQIKLQADRLGEYYFHVNCQFNNYDQLGEPSISFHAYIHRLDSARGSSIDKVIDNIRNQINAIQQLKNTDDVLVEIEDLSVDAKPKFFEQGDHSEQDKNVEEY